MDNLNLSGVIMRENERSEVNKTFNTTDGF